MDLDEDLGMDLGNNSIEKVTSGGHRLCEKKMQVYMNMK
jgi:hypothetical protein